MFKKSVLVLLCLLGISVIAFGSEFGNFQDNWHNTSQGGTGTTSDWFDGNNWGSQENGNGPSPVPPDYRTWACIEAKPSDPCISMSSPYYVTGGARTSRLSIHPWAWGGAPDIRVTLESGDFNCGQLIGLCDLLQFNSDGSGQAILDINGGTIFTGGIPNILDWNTLPDINDNDYNSTDPWIEGEGLWIGGGSNGLGANYGTVNIRNDGQMIVQRIFVNYGDVNILGGLLYQTDPCAQYLSIALGRTRNKINIAGGELRLAGDMRDRVNYYIGKGRILA